MSTPEELFEANKFFGYFVLRKYHPKWAFDEDIRAIADLGLWKACIWFDESKGYKFTALATRTILNEVYREFRHIQRHDFEKGTDLLVVSLDGKVANDSDSLQLSEVIADSKSQDFEETIALYDQIKRGYKELSEKEKRIFQLYLQGKCASEIADELKCARSGISRAKDRIKKKLGFLEGV